MKVYDCFLFFDELDLLEIRLNYLNSVVDYFVIAESSKTFSMKEKPFYLKENQERFSSFWHKIIRIGIEDFANNYTWANERYQRDCLARGFDQAEPDDIIMISDCDEIPRKEKICEYNLSLPISGFKQTMYYYYLNGLTNVSWCGTKIFQKKYFQSSSSVIRETPCTLDGYMIFDGGWHFSFLGQTDRIIKKIQSFSHQELNRPEFTDQQKLKERIEAGKDLFDRSDIGINYCPIDDTYPDYVLQNQDKLKDYIHERK